MENNKVLITGAGGWLGCELTEQLLKEGKNVRAINNVYTEKLRQIKNEYNSQLEVVIGDICNQELMEENLKGIEIVFHLAAKVHTIPKNQMEEDEFFRINAEASKNLFNNCIKNNI